MKKLLPLSFIVATTSIHVTADNLYPFHARAMAMGNTGVASARSSGAAFFNSSLMAQQDPKDDFEVLLPALGVLAADDDELINNIDHIDETGSIDTFTDAVDNYNSLIDGTSTPNQALANNAALQIRNAITDLDLQIQSIDKNTLRATASAGLVIVIPSKNFSIAFTATGHASAAAIFNYNDSDTVTLYSNTLVNLTSDLVNARSKEAILNDSDYLDLIEEDVDGDIRLREPTLESEIEGVAFGLTELALPMAREFEISGQKIAFGITPKYVDVKTYDYIARVINEGVDGIEDIEAAFKETEETDHNFNLDIGASYQKNNWTAGLSLHNLLTQKYETVTTRTIKITPQARIGAAYNGDWFTVAMDWDITEQNGLFPNQETQFLATGVEFDLWEILQLRAGYNHNRSNPDTDMVSAGLGLSVIGIMVELAVSQAPDIDAYGGAFQIGFLY